MITKELIEIYIKYNGNLDGFVKCANEIERMQIHSIDWMKIDNALQDIYIIDRNLSSEIFNKEVNIRLSNDFNNEAVELLKTYLLNNNE